MGKNHPKYHQLFSQLFINKQEEQLYNKLKHWYNTQHFELLTQQKTPKIPKIIHQIWLSRDNRKTIPEKYLNYLQTWLDLHPDWEYKLWTNNDIEKLNLENKDLYNRAINYGERSDIARYEILWRFGGLYIDTDFQCIKPFDLLHYCYDLYTGIELPAMASFLQHRIIMANGLIGVRAKHPVMQACINKLRISLHEKDIINRSGPLLFMNAFMQHANKNGNVDIALPAFYFYPTNKETHTPEQLQQLLQSETFAVHHWCGSWILQQSAFIPGIKLTSIQEKNIVKFKLTRE